MTPFTRFRIAPKPNRFCNAPKPGTEIRHRGADHRFSWSARLRSSPLRRSRRGNTIIEAAIFLPILFLLLMGMEQIAKVTYVYYSIKKAEYTIARYVATQQGVNFCAGQSDPAIAAAINLGLSGTTDGTGTSFIPNLTADMIVVQPERLDSTGALTACSCDVTGCDESVGGGSPAYITVSIPSGYPVQPIIPFTTLQSIPLVPSVKVPYGGT